MFCKGRGNRSFRRIQGHRGAEGCPRQPGGAGRRAPGAFGGPRAARAAAPPIPYPARADGSTGATIPYPARADGLTATHPLPGASGWFGPRRHPSPTRRRDGLARACTHPLPGGGMVCTAHAPTPYPADAAHPNRARTHPLPGGGGPFPTTALPGPFQHRRRTDHPPPTRRPAAGALLLPTAHARWPEGLLPSSRPGVC